MEDELNLPIALRRTSRRSGGSMCSSPASKRLSDILTSTSTTPSKPKPKKRVRFSDPGPEIEHHDVSSSSSTGLTPLVRRSTLGVAPTPKRRRNSTPTRDSDYGNEDELAGDGKTTCSSNNEIRFLSLRQILDDRVKRRIRRNGLSEEMNTINESKRKRAQCQKEELQRLRTELTEKDHEIAHLRDTTTAIYDTTRILELEQQVSHLRGKLGGNNSPSDTDAAGANQTLAYDWTLAARDPFSDSYMEEGFGDATMAEFVCSTPSRVRASFPSPPATSPAMPATPCSLRRRRSMPTTPSSHTVGVQACFPDPEKEELEAELGSLRLELVKLTSMLEGHELLKSRLQDRLAAVHTPSAAPDSDSNETPDVEAHLDSVLQTLSDRTAGLLDLNASLGALGFPGKDASEIVASLAGAFRSARLELEYLTPGEIALPLSSHGAEVLDLVLTRLRELAHKVREGEEAVDEYHELELSLRQQLGARVEAMDSQKTRLRERDERIGELEVGVSRLKGAVEGYRRDVGELEALVQRMDDEGNDAVAKLQREVDAGKAEVACTDNSMAELKARLASVLSQTGDLRIQLVNVQAQKAADVAHLNQSHGRALALRDARVTELRGEIDGINGELRKAHETIRKLRVEKGVLEGSVDEEKRRAKEAIDAMKAELERVLRMSERILATPVKGASGRASSRRSAESRPDSAVEAGSYLSGDLLRTGKGKKRQRYDSGLGFLDEEEVDLIEA